MTQDEEYEALVEACAIALAEADTEGLWDHICEREPFPRFWEGCLTTKDDLRKGARAVLAVIAEKAKEWPTERMSRAFWRSCDDLRNMDVHKDWRAMWRASPIVKPEEDSK